MKQSYLAVLAGFLLLSPLSLSHAQTGASPQGWLNWRGPNQNGTSPETALPERFALNGTGHLWTAELSGMSTPAIANGKLYVLGFRGEGSDLQEVIAAFDAETGQHLWEHRYNDFLSDIIYNRYSTSNPTVDPETGNVYKQGTQGIIAAFTADGKPLWKYSMMESYGRMTFPNGRTASPIIDGELVITHGITSNWGAHGPAGHRFYAFDKQTGRLVWTSSPGARPRDSSYSPPTLSWWNGYRVMYCGIGDGSIVAVNARTGEPLWRVQISQGGINTAVLEHNQDKLITIHGSENIDSSEIGRMVAIRIPTQLPESPSGEPVVFQMKELELWRNELSAFTSSPILVGDTVYQVNETGDLCAIDAANGSILWRHKIGIEQRNASLIHADGKLYVPMLEDPEAGGAAKGQKGAFYIIRPGKQGPEVLSKVQLDGRCFGSPAVANGRIYLQTTEKIYAFGDGSPRPALPPAPPVKAPAPGPAASLQIIPSELVLHPGESASFRIRELDAKGFVVRELEDISKVQWASYIPPTARVRSEMDASFNSKGELVAGKNPVPSAGAFEASWNGLKGYIRGRVLPDPPITEDFSGVELNETHEVEGLKFAYPPLPWIGARFKFEVREQDGSNVLVKTVDNRLFQRAFVFLGYPSMNSYTIEADVMSEGTRRKMSEVGLINQRYCIVLKGNAQELEVNSNLERIRVSTPFRWSPKTWYRLKTRVDLQEDGSGVVRAKAWPREETEPEAWTIEVPHRQAHASGSPGLFGFSPQDMRVYIDNIAVTQNN